MRADVYLYQSCIVKTNISMLVFLFSIHSILWLRPKCWLLKNMTRNNGFDGIHVIDWMIESKTEGLSSVILIGRETNNTVVVDSVQQTFHTFCITILLFCFVWISSSNIFFYQLKYTITVQASILVIRTLPTLTIVMLYL